MLGLLGQRAIYAGKSAMLSSAKRYASTAAKLVQVTKNEENGVSVVSMARNPVNGLNLELLNDLNEALMNTRKDGSKGVILTSSLSKIFSAGLDIMEMYKPDEVRVENFWKKLQDTWMTLYSMDIPTAAAINGASPAGGCLLALSCEYRVMVEGKHTIGLNETRLGIVAPPWFTTLIIDTIGYRQSEAALLRGALYKPEEALKIGLVDELATDKEDALAKCHNFIDSFSNIPARARAATKSNLRSARIAWLKENRDQDLTIFLNYLKDPQVQAGLDFYIQLLKNKSKL